MVTVGTFDFVRQSAKPGKERTVIQNLCEPRLALRVKAGEVLA